MSTNNNKKVALKDKPVDKAPQEEQPQAPNQQQVITVANAFANLSNRIAQLDLRIQKNESNNDILKREQDLLYREIDFINKKLD